jgi:AbrB family looped-hinge helix DNA binding protein
VVIPKEIRARLGLSGGEAIEIRERDGTIEIEPTPTAVALIDRGAGPVAVPDTKLPPLTDDIVRSTLERTRRRSRPIRAWWSPRLPLHEGHRAAHAALTRQSRLPAHVAAETYSVLTRLPPPHRVTSEVVARQAGAVLLTRDHRVTRIYGALDVPFRFVRSGRGGLGRRRTKRHDRSSHVVVPRRR